MSNEFKLEHKSATLEKTLLAADRIELLIGKVANGERRALDKLSIEDVALLVQFVRDRREG
jgi:hypothetical protein